MPRIILHRSSFFKFMTFCITFVKKHDIDGLRAAILASDEDLFYNGNLCTSLLTIFRYYG